MTFSNWWDIVLQEILAEEIGRKIARKLEELMPKAEPTIIPPPEVKVTLPELPQIKIPQFRTIPINYKNKTVANYEVLVNEAGIGEVVTFTIISPSSNFSIYVRNEQGEIWNDTYTTLSTLAPSVSNLTARSYGGNYIVHFSGIKFLENILIRINVSEEITFSTIHGQINLLEVV